MQIKKITLVGSGAWGMALAMHLAKENRCQIALWSARAASRESLQVNRGNQALLPGATLPPSVAVPDHLKSALEGSDLLVSAVPSAHLRSVMETLRAFVPLNIPYLSTTKGLERGTFLRPSEVIEAVLGKRPGAILSGPSHAEEVARGLPTSLVVAGSEDSLNQGIQALFNSESFRVYTNFDPLGVELAGALKNIVAIAAGINDGLGFGDNSKAALMTRGLVEITRLGVGLGAQPRTFQGLAGLGDLIATCTSRHSRNRLVGEKIGRGENPAEFLPRMVQVAEGVFTITPVRDLALSKNIDMPIMEQIYQVLFCGKAARSAVLDLMSRLPKEE
ncbi:MAG: NAD(P)-dependent glycerol-3-phosphate dehydrogenase [Gemmataceae bacterium]|nr:NAD(P)-dependent glycerol-3-phosphate dehydrogenase [Gemmataceae bacterium]